MTDGTGRFNAEAPSIKSSASTPPMPYESNTVEVLRDLDRSGVGFALNAALGRAATVIASDALTSGHGTTADDYLQLLTPVVDALITSTESDRPPACVLLPFGLIPAHLDALRLEFLGALNQAESSSIDAAQLVSVLTTLEDLTGRVRLGVRNQFVDQLCAPDALQAVIEVAHDMRAPLGSILFLVDTIRRGQSGAVSTVQERQLGLIYGAALGLSNVACDVVDAVRGNRLVDGRPRPFSIEELMTSINAIVRPIGEEKGLPISLHFPTVDGRLGYPAALHRVLLNLLSNALRYTETGSVSMGCEEISGTRVRFWVEDTGTGIPPGVMSMIYDGFRPGSVGLRFSSAGLGLAICRSLLNAMGSALSIETSTHGTRFDFELELEPVQ